MNVGIPQDRLTVLSERIAQKMGIFFQPSHYADMVKGIEEASYKLGFNNSLDCIDWLIHATPDKEQIGILASSLTIGETYFFREKASFDALEKNILPEFIRDRRWKGRRLNIWSAACCTGEEPYSIAILLSRILSDIHLWNVKITATDLNPDFLAKAQKAEYGEWSFRDVHETVKSSFFNKNAHNNYELINPIKNMVQFELYNLMEDSFPQGLLFDQKVDILFCRNVLMYFNRQNQLQVVEKLCNILSDNGYLVPGLTEVSDIFTSCFSPVSFPGALLYRKKTQTDSSIDSSVRKRQVSLCIESPIFNKSIYPASTGPSIPPMQSIPQSKRTLLTGGEETVKTTLETAKQKIDAGHHDEAIQLLKQAFPTDVMPIEAWLLTARARANQGQLTAAEQCVQKALSMDRLSIQAHHFLALLQQEQGNFDAAVKTLLRVLYLEPNFIPAHFAIAQISLNQGDLKLSEKHFRNALILLKRMPPDVIVSETDGLTVNRMIDLVIRLAPFKLEK